MSSSQEFTYRFFHVPQGLWALPIFLAVVSLSDGFPYRLFTSLSALAISLVMGYAVFIPKKHRRHIYRSLCRLYKAEHIAVKRENTVPKPLDLWLPQAEYAEGNVDKLVPIVCVGHDGLQEEYLRYVKTGNRITVIAASEIADEKLVFTKIGVKE